MSFINSATTTLLGFMFQMPQRQGSNTASPKEIVPIEGASPTALRQPCVPENLKIVDSHTTEPDSDISYWETTIGMAHGVYTTMASFFAAEPDPEPKSPEKIPISGGFGVSHLGRLGLLLGFFATSSAARLREISGESSHTYSTNTKAIDGTNDWFRIAHIGIR